LKYLTITILFLLVACSSKEDLNYYLDAGQTSIPTATPTPAESTLSLNKKDNLCKFNTSLCKSYFDNDEDFNSLHKRSNYSSFPQIFIDEEFIGGYTELSELHASGKLSSF